MIEDQIKEFETEYPVIRIALIGSILTKRYRNDADLDINVLFDVPSDKAEDERLRLSKKFLSANKSAISTLNIVVSPNLSIDNAFTLSLNVDIFNLPPSFRDNK